MFRLIQCKINGQCLIADIWKLEQARRTPTDFSYLRYVVVQSALLSPCPFYLRGNSDRSAKPKSVMVYLYLRIYTYVYMLLCHSDKILPNFFLECSTRYQHITVTMEAVGLPHRKYPICRNRIRDKHRSVAVITTLTDNGDLPQ